MYKKKTLLERYGIPIHHLDFAYINECSNAREMEKIVRILRSGEEGYYAELTACAEEKLRALYPNSRLLRVEEKLLGRYALTNNELKPIYDWNQEIKEKDSTLQQLSEQLPPLEKGEENSDDIVPIRKTGCIYLDNKNNKASPHKESSTSSNNNKEKQERIASTDYTKWDKYDPDEEILRMELTDERTKEEIDRKNRINMEKTKAANKSAMQSKSTKHLLESKLKDLSNIEKEKLSEGYRLRGNEYFRAKEYNNALNEYSKAISAYPQKAATSYNNRALTYYKMQRYYESITDCKECLKLEPNNVKARLRLADATFAYGSKGESYNLYMNVLDVDPNNAAAIKAITELKQLNITPPANATRMQIQDASIVKSTNDVKPMPTASTTKTNTEEKSQIENKISGTQKAANTIIKDSKTKPVEYDFAELIKPNRIVKNKLFSAAEKLSKIHTNPCPRDSSTERLIENDLSELRLPTNRNKKNKVLIEEL